MVSCFSLSGFGILHRTAVWCHPPPPTGNFRWKLFSPAQLSPTTRVLLIPCQKDFSKCGTRRPLTITKGGNIFLRLAEAATIHNMSSCLVSTECLTSQKERQPIIFLRQYSHEFLSALVSSSVNMAPSFPRGGNLLQIEMGSPIYMGYFGERFTLGTEPLANASWRSSLSAWPSQEQSHLSGLKPGSSPWD
jgi:hypothetical protein